MELTFEELKQLEYLLKKAHRVGDCPYFGRTTQVWIKDGIDRFEEYNQRKVEK